MPKLNLGCGKDIKKGWINIDNIKLEGIDVVHNLNKYPWPFKDSYFEEAYCKDCIEHLDNLFFAMSEIKRICKPNAIATIIVPYWHSSSAFYPNHKYFFNTDTMKFFTEKGRTYDSYYGFRLKKINLVPSRIGKLIPPVPIPKSIFQNVLNLRHLISYFFGEIIIKIEFVLEVDK